MPALSRCLLLLLIASPLAAQPPEQGPPPRHVDRYGDPLPTGAIQRFGSLRLRHPDLCDFTVLADGKTVVTMGRDKTIRHWDLGSQKQTGTWSLPDEFHYGGTLSADGRTAVCETSFDRVEYVAVFEVATGRMTGAFPVNDTRNVHGLAVSPDGNRAAAQLSPDVRDLLEKLAAKHSGPIPPSETLRFLRALAVLEEVKTPAARRLVEALTRGVATARETKAAAATLARMPDQESWRR